MPDIENLSIEQRVILWFLTGETGISSKTICYALSGLHLCTYIKKEDEILYSQSSRNWSVPHDPSDFRRCYLLLEFIPEWRSRLPEVAERFPKWKPFVDAWDELESLYKEEINNPDGRAPKLYARMRELII